MRGNASHVADELEARCVTIRFLQHGFDFKFSEYARLGRLQYAVETAQHGKRKDDPAVLGLFVVATQQVSDGPDEG